MKKRKIKLVASITAGALGATAGPIGAAAAVAASQLLVDGAYYALDVIRDRHDTALEHKEGEAPHTTPSLHVVS